MTTNTFYQTMQDGTEINVMRWIPDGEIKGVIQLSHGMSEHCLRYDKLGCILAENGWVLSAHDHRGHGKTAQKAEAAGKGMFGYLADKDGFNKVEADLLEVLLNLKADYPQKKCFLVGHSFGSIVAQNFMEKNGSTRFCGEKSTAPAGTQAWPFLATTAAFPGPKKHSHGLAKTTLTCICTRRTSGAE